MPIDQAPLCDFLLCEGRACLAAAASFKAMLLSIWYDLSDVKLAEALDDRGSFRRFCGFSVQEPKPERTAFVRFRKALVAHGLDKTLFDENTRQLKAKAIQVKTGTLVDATIIASASEADESSGYGRWGELARHTAPRACQSQAVHL
ncbi:transposase [Ensifer sp. IC4062]|nr:transposase [Ensifer sp. IC4062]